MLNIWQLTLMSSLDTLDISHNKIKRLPTQPGNLVNLRVRTAFLFLLSSIADLFPGVLFFTE